MNVVSESLTGTAITLANQMSNTAARAMFGRVYVHITTTLTVVEGQLFAYKYDGTLARIYNVGGAHATTSRANGFRLRASPETPADLSGSIGSRTHDDSF